MSSAHRSLIPIAFTLLASTAIAADGIRVATWNITYYDGTRAQEIGKVCYGEWNGKSMSPDVICLQEMLGRIPTLQFVQAMNEAPGSPGDWIAAPIYNDPRGGLQTALVYRTSKLEYIESELISVGAGPPQQPRNIVRFDMRAIGYNEDESIISFFPLHYKAGYTDSDLARKLVESQIVREHIETLPENRHVILGADLNIQHSTDPAYEELNGVVPNTGVLWDPISRPGTWNNNAAFRNLHTQDPTGGGGMDDRLDQILLSPSLLDGVGFEYDGKFESPWDLSTTEDPNHSYRAWGNDGTTYNQQLRASGNQMVGDEIAQAIKDMADPDGHIPVFLDLNVPPRIRVIGEHHDLGEVVHGMNPELVVRVGNGADTQLWGPSGVATLQYHFETNAPIVVPDETFVSDAGIQLVTHLISVESGAYGVPGEYRETVKLVSDDPAAPEYPILIEFQIVGCNSADLVAPLGQHTFTDVSAFISSFLNSDDAADIAEPHGVLNFFDVSAFLAAYVSGCD